MELLPIHTARLLLRRFTSDDLIAFQSYRSDPEVGRYQGWEPISDDAALAFLTDQSRKAFGPAGQWVQVAVTRLDTGELIGDLGICVTDEHAGVVELGYTIARPAQGNGYATETLTAMLAPLLSTPGIRSIVAVTDARNAASIALLQCVGFAHQCTKSTIFRGQPCDEHTFAFAAREDSLNGPDKE